MDKLTEQEREDAARALTQPAAGFLATAYRDALERASPEVRELIRSGALLKSDFHDHLGEFARNALFRPIAPRALPEPPQPMRIPERTTNDE